MAKYFFWSKLPFINRINELDASIPLTAIYGDHSWMPSVTREEYEHARNGEGYCRVKVTLIKSIILLIKPHFQPQTSGKTYQAITMNKVMFLFIINSDCGRRRAPRLQQV